MSLAKQFATNSSKEIDGVAVQYGANEDGSIPEFIVSRMAKTNKKYAKAIEAATRPYRRQIEIGTMDNDVAERLFMGVFADTVLKSWQNVKLSDVTGNPKDEGFAEFTKENAISLFKNLPEMYDDLQEKAKSASMFREEVLEEEAKN